MSFQTTITNFAIILHIFDFAFSASRSEAFPWDGRVWD